ncbi:DUF2267 domain-containing protein [uncultured Piscinibacter sp.]|uniref:DUF2267 domain-containing protein n=1 Tax=uncultured Piscinibacter sp. TaxID=1131835 RepID=UPI0026185DE8|nr:DUF2267 domain-containing protein [uncultured Piscinibacter sp.]
MPVPSEYQRASLDFEAFLVDARDFAGLVTTNQAYTMVEGVFRTFRCRLSMAEGLAFANVLPPVLRALFVEDWDTSAPVQPFASRETMTAEVQALREAHNFSPANAISSVATALRKHVQHERLEQVLAKLPTGAIQFWVAE